MTEVRITLPDRARPHHSASTDQARPHLHGGWLYKHEGKSLLIVSDSYQLAALPVEAAIRKGAKPIFVPADALRDAGPGGEVVLHEDGLIEMFGAQRKARGRRAIPHLYRMPKLDRKPPDFLSVLGKSTPAADARTLSLGFNAELLYDLARALGATRKAWSGVKFTLDLTDVTISDGANAYQKPLFVQPIHNNDGRSGILMPVRLNI